MEYLVSVMIPAYNLPQYIEQAVSSALSQDYPNLEVIVSDDSTNNETLNVLKPFISDKRFAYHRNEKNLGRVGNYRKLLFELAKGKWVVMLDGDDYFVDPGYIRKAMEVIDKDDSIVLAGAAIKVFYEASHTFDTIGLGIGRTKFDGQEVFSKFQQLPNHQTDIYLRSLACDLDFYRDPSAASDSESLYRLCLHGRVAYFPEEVAVWRVHNENTTYTRNLGKQIKELVFIDNVYRYALKYIDKDVAGNWRKNMYRSMSIHLLNLAFEKKNYAGVIKILFRFGSYLGSKNTFLYFMRILRSYGRALIPKPVISR